MRTAIILLILAIVSCAGFANPSPTKADKRFIQTVSILLGSLDQTAEQMEDLLVTAGFVNAGTHAGITFWQHPVLGVKDVDFSVLTESSGSADFSMDEILWKMKFNGVMINHNTETDSPALLGIAVPLEFASSVSTATVENGFSGEPPDVDDPNRIPNPDGSTPSWVYTLLNTKNRVSLIIRAYSDYGSFLFARASW